ncbi:hypothetical protein AALP_AA5G233600 [Arabis alpina]|uniref:ENT domain-containing protein n=1 Tax=Arabis alpina TaxID=50452 RepID=A0A087GYY5_ARAAL|nr:hypothetical protein AALP_AA5G233600 [Arabis alpina]
MSDQKVQDPNPRAESECDSEFNSSDDGDKEKLEELKKKAFYYLLHAFAAESSTIKPGTSIVKRLINEWNIPHETQISMENHIPKHLLAQQQQIVETKSENNTTLNPACVVATSDDFEEFIIKMYDPKQEMHRLELVGSDAMEMDDVLSWTDIRQIPPRDIGGAW